MNKSEFLIQYRQRQQICPFNKDKNNEKVNFAFTNDDCSNDNDIKLHEHINKDNERVCC